MNNLREAAQQALEVLESIEPWEVVDHDPFAEAITALRAALAEPVQFGSCIACGNRMTGSTKSFVVATAEVGVTAPEGYSPQQVEALHPKGGDKTAPPPWHGIGGEE